MFPYDYVLHNVLEKSNQSLSILDCTVNDNDSLFSSCLFTIGFYYVLPLTIIGLCYFRVLLYIRRSGYKVAKQLVSYDMLLLNS
jgi:hypothetical protein